MHLCRVRACGREVRGEQAREVSRCVAQKVVVRVENGDRVGVEGVVRLPDEREGLAAHQVPDVQLADPEGDPYR